MHFLQGKGLKITGDGFISGHDVTFYVGEGAFVLTGTGGTDLTAPDSGDYAGVLIFQNRSMTSTVNLSGAAVASLEGAAYAPAAQIRVTGNSTTSFQFVSTTFLLAGNSDITTEYDSDLSMGVPAVRLCE